MTNAPRPILTAAAMRDAEQRAIDGGTSVEALMERAGHALAEAVRLLAGAGEVLLLCGPGNNGGDGYVAARHLGEMGFAVRVAASAPPGTDAAKAAAKAWGGRADTIADAESAPILIDCLFGTGLKKPLEASVFDRLTELANAARMRIACDLPSGVAADSGACLSAIPAFDLTVALGALKPAHRLMPAMARMGRVAVADLGLDSTSEWFEIARPTFPPLKPGGHKYDRGLVHCLAGQMPGAIALAARAAAAGGAGYVRVSTSRSIDNLPSAIVQTETAQVNDPRIGCLLVGPGLGDIPQVLTLALTAPKPVVIDADAIALVGDPGRLKGHDAILTPHDGEFAKLFGDLAGTKPERALAAAKASGAMVVFKGADTLVASPDGRLGFAPPSPAWLASAGTGDVLAGLIAALRARGLPSFEAACAGVWLHGRAAERAGPGMIADDLIGAIPAVLS